MVYFISIYTHIFISFWLGDKTNKQQGVAVAICRTSGTICSIINCCRWPPKKHKPKKKEAGEKQGFQAEDYTI